MARITVDDCLKKIPNRFELVVVASKRARVLAYGSEEAHVAWENDKPTVVALREIANGSVTKAILDEQERSPEQIVAAEQADDVAQTDQA